MLVQDEISKNEISWLGRLERVATGINRAADTGVCILNGIIGDYLHDQQNELAFPMQLYFQNEPLNLTPESLKISHPNITSKACILVHGLACDQTIWNYADEHETTYGSLLQRDLGYTPFYLRYNTGRHISENGKMLSARLSNLFRAYPKPLEEIILIGHSMGGLVTRSACDYGTEEQADWVKKVRKVFFLGSPHLGAPLEKFVNVVSWILKAVPRPYTKLGGDILDLRSSGIKDLRFGYLRDEDWTRQDPDALLKNNKKTIPLLDGASHYVITGTLTQDPRHPLTQWFGDGLVRQPSAAGQLSQESHDIPFVPGHHREFPRVGHIKLTHSPGVYQQIKSWCREASPSGSPRCQKAT
ncbi:MAG: alpha/beta fold hydrolase [Deltaproteobacteria bacterium]|nr:alpha/beta fold hydrolase [Deltaproteobacteria bacterium]